MSAEQALVCYQSLPQWGRDDIPEALWAAYRVDEGVWLALAVLSGGLSVALLDEAGEVAAVHALTPESNKLLIEPQQSFRIESLSGDTRIQLALYCEAADYFHKKYGMSATHSAVRAAASVVPVGKALDMGCGQGRNALFLGLQGFEVTAVDHNPQAVQSVAELAQAEQLNIKALEYDLNAANLPEDYDYIVATVVLMFLQPRLVPQVIADMQAHTRTGGYNLIVSAMDTADFPCPMPFPFKFQEGELRRYYQDWDIVEYQEALGVMHAKDEFGNPIQFKFVTMLAKKTQ